MQHAERRVQYSFGDWDDNTLHYKNDGIRFPRCPPRDSFRRPEPLVFQTCLTAVGTHRLNVAVGPDNGPTLLLLHGVTRSWNDWANLFGHLTPRWRIVAFDFRGHGDSDRNEAGYRVVDYVQDAIAALRQFAGEPAVVFGHSLGAMVAAAVAAEAPQAVRAVVLEDPPFHTMGRRIAETPLLDYFRQLAKLVARRDAGPLSVAEMAKRLADVRMRSPDGQREQRLGEVRDAAALRFAAAYLGRIDRDVLAPIVTGRWLDGYDADAIARAVQCPALLLQADPAAGGMLIDADADAFENNAADCIRCRFAGTGHLIHGTQTSALVAAVIPFLESLREGDDASSRRRDAAAEAPTDEADKSHRVDGHETRHRHDSHTKRPVG